MFIITRLAHYIKVLQRENIGSWKERSDLERELNNWINQYVAEMDDAGAAPCGRGGRSARPRSPSRTSRAIRAGTRST